MAKPTCRTHYSQVLGAFLSEGAKAAQAIMNRPSFSRTWLRHAPIAPTPPHHIIRGTLRVGTETQTLGASWLGNQHTQMLEDTCST